VGVDAEADSDRTEGVLTTDLQKYRDGGEEVKKAKGRMKKFGWWARKAFSPYI
jgi:hypothetical protein